MRITLAAGTKVLDANGRTRVIKEDLEVEREGSLLRYPSGTVRFIYKNHPSLATMEKWMDTGIARAIDGCKVEPDGVCPHGAHSWLTGFGI